MPCEAMLLRAAEHLERTLVPRLRANARVQARDGLDVVVQDLGPRGEHGVQRFRAPHEVGDQHLDGRRGRLTADLADRIREDLGAAVRQLVAVHARHDRVAERHLGDRLTDAPRLVGVHAARPPGLHGAEAARPRAGVAEDHERRGASAPALRHVRAVRFFADRVQLFAAHEAPQVLVGRPGRQADLEPRGPRAIDRYDGVRRAAPARTRTLHVARHLEHDRRELRH